MDRRDFTVPRSTEQPLEQGDSASGGATDIIKRYRAGESLRALASSMGMPRNRIRQLLVDAGEPIHRYQKVALPTAPSWWVEQFDEGLTVSDLAAQMATNHMNVYRQLKVLGVPPPRDQSAEKWFSARTTRDGSCLRWTGNSTNGRPVGKFHGSHGRSVRRIVWEHTYGPIPEGAWIVRTTECRHLDCVEASHLRVVTPQSNIAERVQSRRFRWGQEHGHAKLTEEQARTILESRSSSPGELADRFQVSQATIYAIWSGRRWGHLEPTS